MNQSLPLCEDFQLWNDSVNASAAINEDWLAWFGVSFGKLHGPFSLAVCAFGISTNLANIVVLTRPALANSATNQLLLCLAVADLITMLIYVPGLCHFYIAQPTPMKSPIYSPSKNWVTYQTGAASGVIVFHSVAIWITVILAVFRYIHIGFPSVGPRIATKRRAVISVFMATVICFVIVIPNALINYVDSCLGPGDNLRHLRVYYFVNVPSLDESTESCWKQFHKQCMLVFNFWSQATVYKILPCFLLATLTVLLIYELRLATRRRKKLHCLRERMHGQNLLSDCQTQQMPQGKRHDERNQQYNENRTTSLLLTILIFFLIVEMPQGVLVICLHLIPDFYERVYRHLGDFIDFTTLVNEAINFVIYTTMSQQFRLTFCKVFYIKRIKCWVIGHFSRHAPVSSGMNRATAAENAKSECLVIGALDPYASSAVPGRMIETSVAENMVN
ncbi:probable G-protein coupled receptor B0563.6 [Clonorchis sinensis]|uniref:Probable G-protein coupled receptor B0563.6 n=1 Tax=Clonorchis sinensis TaxID=79923 RepID=H2KSR6_CLOSI|nr:probable G-protein coupled receptor B0563.6 [Clonorchis sinensis]